MSPSFLSHQRETITWLVSVVLECVSQSGLYRWTERVAKIPCGSLPVGHRAIPGPLLRYRGMGWLNFRHCDHSLNKQNCHCPSKQCLCKSSFSSTREMFKNTKLNKQKALNSLFTFYISFTLWRMPAILSDLLVMKSQANIEKIDFSVSQRLCRCACGGEIQTAFIFELALKLKYYLMVLASHHQHFHAVSQRTVQFPAWANDKIEFDFQTFSKWMNK